MIVVRLEVLPTTYAANGLPRVGFFEGEDSKQKVTNEVGRETFTLEVFRKIGVQVTSDVMVQNEFPQKTVICCGFIHKPNQRWSEVLISDHHHTDEFVGHQVGCDRVNQHVGEQVEVDQ